MLRDCFQVSCFPGAKHWVESPWCVGMFWQAWAIPRGIRQDPPGSQGCVPQSPTAERGSWLCKGPPARLWASLGHIGHKRPETLTSAPLVHWNWEGAWEPLIYWFNFWTKDDGLIQHVGKFFWSQGVLDEIQSGGRTHDALAGELTRSNNALANLGHQRKKKKIYATEHLSEAPYENRPSGFTAVHLLTLQPTTVSLLGDTCWICHTFRTKL